MTVLVIDTCGSVGSVALANHAGGVIAKATLPGRAASERLVAAIRTLLEGRGIAPAELGAVAVVHGPGSFTGVRVGVSAAKGLCEALDIPLLAISRLAVLAEAGGSAGGAEEICAVLDAGRGEFYLGEYQGETCLREGLVKREEVFALSAGVCRLIACEQAVVDRLEGLEVTLVPEPDAAVAVPIALRRMARGTFDDVALIDANYLRRTDAEILMRLGLKEIRDDSAALR